MLQIEHPDDLHLIANLIRVFLYAGTKFLITQRSLRLSFTGRIQKSPF